MWDDGLKVIVMPDGWLAVFMGETLSVLAGDLAGAFGCALIGFWFCFGWCSVFRCFRVKPRCRGVNHANHTIFP